MCQILINKYIKRRRKFLPFPLTKKKKRIQNECNKSDKQPAI